MKPILPKSPNKYSGKSSILVPFRLARGGSLGRINTTK